jgi:hypothetical protein
MPYIPENVTGVLVEAVATSELRWVRGLNRRFPELQQAWTVLATGQLEWRDVPLVEEN